MTMTSQPQQNLRRRKHKNISSDENIIETTTSTTTEEVATATAAAIVTDEDDNEQQQQQQQEQDTDSTSDIHFDNVIPLKQRTSYVRLDVLPFALIYVLCIYADCNYSQLSSSSNNDSDVAAAATTPSSNHALVQLLITVVMGITLVVHVGLVLASQWSVQVQVFVGYYKQHLNTPKTMHNWTHAYVQSNDGEGIVPVRVHVDEDDQDQDDQDSNVAVVAICRFHDVTLRCSTRQPADYDVTLWQQQKPKIIEEVGKGGTTSQQQQLRFRRLQYPIGLPLTYYINSNTVIGHTTMARATLALHLYGYNTTTLDIPPWSSILMKQLVQPFFIFQFLCVILWMLDEYWYYALYTLGALLILESTVAYQQWQSLQRLHTSTSSAYNTATIWVVRSKRWMRIRIHELVPGDIVRIENPINDDNQSNVVPADILLLRGTAVCDEALLTGESIPQLKRPIGEIITTSSSSDAGGGDSEAAEVRLDLQDHKESILFGGTTTLMVSGGGGDGDGSSKDGTNNDDELEDLVNDDDENNSNAILGYVLRTGFDTTKGSLLRTMAHSSLSKSSSSATHNNWDTFIFICILIVCAIVAAGHVYDHSRTDPTRNQFRLLLHMIIIITSVVPPELPMELSLAITNSVADLMRKKKVFCTEHSAIPTAGQVNMCCFDKTGTLTSDEMRLKGVRLIQQQQEDGDDNVHNDEEDELVLPPASSSALAGANEDEGGGNNEVDAVAVEQQQLPWSTLRIMAACHSLAPAGTNTNLTSSSKRKKKKRGKQSAAAAPTVFGDPLEATVLEHAGYEFVRNNTLAPIDGYFHLTAATAMSCYKPLQILHRFAFTSKLKRMTVVVAEGTGGGGGGGGDYSDFSTSVGHSNKNNIYALTKGAPETIRSLLKSIPDNYDQVAEYHMKRGRRVLAMAYKELSPPSGQRKKGSSRGGRSSNRQKEYTEDRAGIESDLIFAGFLVLDCPLKSDSKFVIKELRKSGHGVVMITGDAILTATEVARQVGIIKLAKQQASSSSSLAPRTIYRIQAAKNKNPTAFLSSSSSSSSSLSDYILTEMLECTPMFASDKDDDGAATTDNKNKNTNLTPLNLKQYIQMKEENKICFCMTGDVLVQIASTVHASLQEKQHRKNNAAAALFDEKHMLLHQTTISILSQIVPLITVFARHTPHQKECVIAAYNHHQGGGGGGGRITTLMCGDGTNDVGALKRANVGISIISNPQVESKQRKVSESIAQHKKNSKKKKTTTKKRKGGSGGGTSIEESLRQLREAQEEELDHVELGDASIAAPFTSRQVSIRCCKDVIQQGRCTLVTMLSIYKILGVNCLVNALVLSKLFLHGVKQGDRQLTCLGIAVAALFYFVTRAEPLTTLSKIRPPSSVMCIEALLSISSQFIIHAATIMIATEAGLYYVDERYDPSFVPDGLFNPNVLNSCSFLLTCQATINTFAVNYRGQPFMADLRHNKLLLRSLQICYAILFICALEIFPPLNDLLQLTELPSTTTAMPTTDNKEPGFLLAQQLASYNIDFRIFICFLMVADTVLSFAAERFIVAKFEGTA